MRELMQKTLRRIISVILVVCMSFSAFLITPKSPTAFAAEKDESNKAPMRRVIDKQHPVDLFTYYIDNGFPTPSGTSEAAKDPTLASKEYDDNINKIEDIVAATPEDLRGSLVFILIGVGDRKVNPDGSFNTTSSHNDYTQSMQTYYQYADIFEKLNVDFVIQQIQGESRTDFFIPMEEFQDMADKYKHFIGFNMAELDNGMGWRGDVYGNQSTYIADAINFCGENGMFVFWKDSNNSGTAPNGMFFDYLQDNQYLYDSMKANHQNVVLMYKQSYIDIETVSTIMGLWLGGFADNWGIAPDWWGFDGPTSINGAAPNRTNAPDTQFAMNLMRSLMNGGTVTCIEAGYYAMNSYGTRIASAMNVYYPLHQDIKHGRLSIPSKEEVLANIKAVALGRAAYGGKGDGGNDIANYTDFTWKPIDPTLNGRGVNQATGKYGLIPSLPLNTDEEVLQRFRDAGIKIVTTQQDQSYYDTLYPDNTLPGTTAFTQNVANTQWWFMNSTYVSETYARTNKDRMQTAKIVPVQNMTTSVDITMPIADFGYMNEVEGGMNFTFNNYIIDHRNMPGGYQWPAFYSFAYRKQANGTYDAVNDDSLATSGRKTTIKLYNQTKKPEVTFIDYDPAVYGIEDIYVTPKYQYTELFENGVYTLEINHNGKVDFNIKTYPDGSAKKELGLNYAMAEALRAEIVKARGVDTTGKTASSVQLLTDTISKAETALAENNAAVYTTILDRLRYAEGKLISSANASATTSIVSSATNDRLELSKFDKAPTKLKITGFTPANPADVFLSYEVNGDSAEVKQITNYDYEITPKKAGKLTITFKTTSGTTLVVTVEVYESALVYRNVAVNATVIGHGKFANAQNLVTPGQYASLHTGLTANRNYKQSELPEGEKLWQDIGSPTNADGSPNTTGTFADDYFIIDLGKEYDIKEINYGVGNTAHHKGTVMMLGNSPDFSKLWNQAPATKVANAGLDKKDWYLAWMSEGNDTNVPATIFPQFGGAGMNYSEQLPNYYDPNGYKWNAIGNRNFSSDFNQIQSGDSSHNPPDVRSWLRTEGNKYRYILVTARASASYGDFASVNINLNVMANGTIDASSNNYEALQGRVNEAKALDEGYKHDGSYKYSYYSRLNLTQQISKAKYIISQKDVQNTVYSQADIDKAVKNLEDAMSMLVETQGLHGLIQNAWEMIHSAGYVYGGGVYENYGTNGTKLTGGATNVYLANLKSGSFNSTKFVQLYRDLQYFMWSYRAPTSVWSTIVPGSINSNIRLDNSGDLTFGKNESWTTASVTAKRIEIDQVIKLLQADINNLTTVDTLSAITAPGNITGRPIGAAKTATALGLPAQVVMVTNTGNVNADVTWNVDASNYDPTVNTPQTFTVNGTVALPIGVVNPNNVPLTTSVSVTVNKIPSSQMTATATSEETGKDIASKAIDGNPQTMWHTKWNKSDVLPQSITLNLGGTYKINKVAYLPRQNGGDNGIITGYNVYVSTDGVTYTKVASGTWANNNAEKVATFDPTEAMYVKLEATAGVNGWASAAEINVFAVEQEQEHQPPTTTDNAPSGWVNQDVTVTLSASDNGSGVANTSYTVDGGAEQTGTSVVLSEEGVHKLVYWSVDKASNVEQAHTVSVRIDKKAPSIAVTVPGDNSIYQDSVDLTPHISLTDILSGVDSSKTTVTLDTYSYQIGTTIPLYTLPLGHHTLVVSSSDLAGNQVSKTVQFTTVASIDSLKALVTRFANNNGIDNAGIANSLLEKLEKSNLKSFVNEVEAQSGKHISSEAAEHLLRDAQYVLTQ